ncbi:hypothetical protein FSP39_023688 [Pinctada imbricata]|uniref:IgGFc-binding protein N-terminal domain-containing protein n=1 Tax=Pinctada imbricata TaxID=66713 RepID=A0AA88YBQ7_PINIB|nr:hypothetical protein FSP39_023688 [Pinctada imbricata]
MLRVYIGAGPDNRGREFIIGYMENNGLTYDVELFITTMRTTVVNVEVTAPRFNSFTISESFSITAGDVKQLFFGPSIRMAGDSLDSKAILITADDEVVMYGVNKERYSNDAYLALPTDVLGTEYYSVTWYPPTLQTELMVVGVNDTTTVTIVLPSGLGGNTVSWNGVNYGAGDTITQVVNRFDTWQITSSGDLTGAYVTSDKIIGLISGNKKTRIGTGGSSDHLTEFLMPVDNWGKNFFTVPIPLRTVGDYFKIIASEDSTTVQIAGGYTETITIAQRGDVIERLIDSGAYCKITADKAILLVQFVQSQQSSSEQSDPAMMIIPPIEQYGADYTFSTPKYSQGSYNNYFMFVVKDADKDGLKLDGVAFSGVTYNTIAGTDYVGGYIAVSDGTHTVRHDSPIKIFGGYLYGQALYETYAFTTGMRLAPINTVCVPSTTGIGDGIDNDCDGLIDEEMCDTANGGAVDGEWSDWSSWGTCTVTCGSGEQSRARTCTNPSPQYGGADCTGDTTEFKNGCNPSACPTASSNNYVQNCPSGWFTCLSGTITCIEDSFKCDCNNDCDDGSDETENYASCSAQVVAYCQAAGGSGNGAGKILHLLLFLINLQYNRI